jgi:hypothetical protein
VQESRLYSRLLGAPEKLCDLGIVCLRLAWLSFVNRFLRGRVTQKDGPVVSLTTYGERINTVYFTIESIGRGRVLPSRLVLWLDDRAAYERPPASLRRLVNRGLEIKLCKNYGPHTKYYPYVESETAFKVPLITADDDVVYPTFWLSGLMEEFHRSPDLVHCYLAKVVALTDDGVAKYADWEFSQSTEPSVHRVAHGVFGALYPLSLLRALKEAGDEFARCCPKADDLWLHVNALRHGCKVKQIHPKPYRFPAIPGTQEAGLWIENQSVGGNDRAVKATYTQRDIEILRAACGQ